MIEVESLTKQFGTKLAVDNLSFSVKPGEVLGFLGPNGAGKSTTMRMVTGFFPPTSGDAKICGISIVDNPAKAKTKIGYLPESAPLYQDMTVTSFLKFCAEIRGLRGSRKRDAVERAIETCFLQNVARQSIDTLSKGYRHRTCLAQALLHDPEVLILDEPTDGLDPNQKYEVRQLIKRLGTTKAILFSTHILEEVEAACTRAVIVDRGKIVADGTPAELIEQSGTGSLTDLFRTVTTRDTEAAA
ncbi:ATP-binding cassette domain-containing protein [Luteolibacter pohnpeiensis]|uniref:ATP-binding cassette domain-containing protein n=1 Tax=Luteolibacter pohnpeiensis TaxID=454153 RepID=A0A934SCJ6_9BACT|nr:ATP-binding cassette domain-containing protein [Luteolibacter pohnpeiensis]MBK1883404.1 ATP-binding cassette domain-containing protein [Luteolibacter pohnpeiensis]